MDVRTIGVWVLKNREDSKRPVEGYVKYKDQPPMDVFIKSLSITAERAWLWCSGRDRGFNLSIDGRGNTETTRTNKFTDPVEVWPRQNPDSLTWIDFSTIIKYLPSEDMIIFTNTYGNDFVFVRANMAKTLTYKVFGWEQCRIKF